MSVAVVTGGSSALTEVLPIGMLKTVNIPKNRLINKTTTTRLTKSLRPLVWLPLVRGTSQQTSVANPDPRLCTCVARCRRDRNPVHHRQGRRRSTAQHRWHGTADRNVARSTSADGVGLHRSSDFAGPARSPRCSQDRGDGARRVRCRVPRQARDSSLSSLVGSTNP